MSDMRPSIFLSADAAAQPSDLRTRTHTHTHALGRVADEGVADAGVSPTGASSPTKRAHLTPEAELEAMRAETRGLHDVVAQLHAQIAYFAREPDGFLGPPKMHAPKISRLPSGVEVRIAGDEMAAMRAIFRLFDRDGSGTLSSADLQQLHLKLGEPITDEEAKEAVTILGQGRDHVTFDECVPAFVLYWDGTHPSQRSAPPGPSLLSPHGNLAQHLHIPGAPLSSPMIRAATGGTVDALDVERARKRQWYQQRFKFLKCKVGNPSVGRIYTVPEGVCPSLEYRVRFYQDDEDGTPVQVSPWHDVPFRNPDGTFNMIVEIPKWTRRKFEIATGEPFNPIKQDVKNATLREYTYGDMLFNYGCIPQTWEDVNVVHPDTNAIGDNDPIDVVDIGTKMWTTGSIVRVKLLGVLAMIDSGETDWKLIAINVEDPIAPLLHDIEDVRVHMPGAAEALHRWLMLYKTPAINEFAYGGQPRNRAFAESLVEETHEFWTRLVEARGAATVVEHKH